MKTYKDFYLTGEYEDLINFKNDIFNHIPKDWEENKSDKCFIDDCIIINYCGNKFDKVIIFLTMVDYYFKVTCIRSIEKNELDYKEYNEILKEYVDNCIIPHIGKYNLSYVLTNEDVDLENYMSEETARKLRQFISAVNQYDYSHPFDIERWNTFVCQAFIDGHEKVIFILEEWLIEEGKWDEENAHELVIRFERSISVLKYYKNNHC